MSSSTHPVPAAAPAAVPGVGAGAGAVSSGERLLLLDVVRGVALLGILVMNMPAFTAAPPSATEWLRGLDHGAEVLRDMLFAGKFNSMFSMLFGLGFMLQLERLQRRYGDDALAVYVRRLAWLLALGLVHAVLVWNGDVLHMYALLGFALLWLRHWRDRTLVALMLLCMLGPALSQVVRAIIAHGAPATTAATLVEPAYAWSEAEIRAYGLGSFLDAVRQSVRGFVDTYTDPQELRHHLGFYAQVTTTMVLGLLVGRHRWLHRIPELMPRIVRIQYASLGLGLGFTAIYGIGHELSAGAPIAKGLVGTCYVLARIALMSFYVLTLVRALQSPAWQRRLAPFAATGRMPLTNYLLQTLMCSVLFYGWGLGWWNRVGAAAELLIAPAMFLLIQLPFSLWWLKRHEQGPFEWLWRRATYGRAPAPVPAPK